MKKFIFILVVIIIGIAFIAKMDIKPEQKEASKEVKHAKFD